jgi:hypothetical protein
MAPCAEPVRRQKCSLARVVAFTLSRLINGTLLPAPFHFRSIPTSHLLFELCPARSMSSSARFASSVSQAPSFVCSAPPSGATPCLTCPCCYSNCSSAPSASDCSCLSVLPPLFATLPPFSPPDPVFLSYRFAHANPCCFFLLVFLGRAALAWPLALPSRLRSSAPVVDGRYSFCVFFYRRRCCSHIGRDPLFLVQSYSYFVV